MRARTMALVSVSAAAVLAAGLLQGLPATAAAPSSDDGSGGPDGARAERVEVRAPVPVIDWHPCPEGSGYPARTRCERVAVPVDYDVPDGDTLSLWLSRRAATRPGERIGTLFANPGGPGESAADFVAFGWPLFPDAVKRRFDIVGIDPRGVARSSPARCRVREPIPFPPRHDVYPITRPQVHRQIVFDRYIRDACADTGNTVLDHMSTADTARDMDLVRQAIGEDQISYYGRSYGTYLGATYAALFPDNVRAIAVDGVLDPVAWATGRRPLQFRRQPFSMRVRAHVASFEALTDAFAACDRAGRRRCALAGGAAVTWRRMLRKVAHGPVHVDGFGTVRYQDFVIEARGALYDRRAIPQLFDLLEQVSHAMLGPDREARGVRDARIALHRTLDQRLVPGPFDGAETTLTRHGASSGRAARMLLPATEGVECTDSLNPARERAWQRAALRAEKRGRWFGRAWTWRSGMCASWPGDDSDAYRGPFEVETSAPLLAIGNTHDAVTSYQGAVTFTDLFPESRLLTLNDYGHTSFGSSDCVGRYLGRYLVHLTLPPAGTVCAPESRLFPK